VAARARGRTIDDPLEREADRIANRVIHMASRESSGAAATSVGRSMSHQMLGLHGQPLERATQAFFEPRFGHDFIRLTWPSSGRRAYPENRN
jgi:hypothetical protein